MPVESHPVAARARHARSSTPTRSRRPTCAASTRRPSAISGTSRKDIDWSQAFDIEQGVLADEMMDIYGTPFWDRLTPAERAELNRRFANWRLGVLLYGEHGAMLLCSQLVECVSGHRRQVLPGHPGGRRGAPQRGAQPLRHRAAGRAALSAAGLRARAVRHAAVGDSRWTVKTIGLQLVAETFAVALFRMLAETSKDPLLRQICQLHPARRVAPHGLRHAEPARRDRRADRGRAGRAGGRHPLGAGARR